jgi:hypothetical protein
VTTPEPHHPSWSWRTELWISALLTVAGTGVAWTRELRLSGAALMLGTLAVVQAAVLITTYLREALRLQRVADRQRETEDRDWS